VHLDECECNTHLRRRVKIRNLCHPSAPVV